MFPYLKQDHTFHVFGYVLGLYHLFLICRNFSHTSKTGRRIVGGDWRMAQRRFSIAVQHPLARAATSTPPQLPLGDETPDNNMTSRATSSNEKTTPNLQGCGRNTNTKTTRKGNRTRGPISDRSAVVTKITTNTKTTRHGNWTHDHIHDGAAINHCDIIMF